MKHKHQWTLELDLAEYLQKDGKPPTFELESSELVCICGETNQVGCIYKQLIKGELK